MAAFDAQGRHLLHAEALPMLHPRPTPQSTPAHRQASLLDSHIQRMRQHLGHRAKCCNPLQIRQSHTSAKHAYASSITAKHLISLMWLEEM